MTTLLIALLLSAPAADPPTARVAALDRELREAHRAWAEATRAADSPEAAAKVASPDGPLFARDFLAIAREHPDDPAAASALTGALTADPFGPTWAGAIERLAARHARSPDIGPALATIALDATRTDVEPFLRAVLRENPSPPVRAEAARALEVHLTRLAGEGANLRAHPDRAARVAATFGEAELRRLRDRDEAALRREADGLLELLRRDYRDLPDGRDSGQTFGAYAESVLRERRDLVVGRPAPEIEGVDLDGRPMRLSEFRGRVVVVSWWASWCGSCLAMAPRERALADRHRDRPFVLLGVNGDEDPGSKRRAIERRGLTWRSWADGGPGGPISAAWHVRSWPTVYVVDPEGLIVYKGGRDADALERAVDAAMADLANAKARQAE